ncbi:hypothetical protein RB195_019811 [Necator americanus]|uniref:ShKT domain-containing protein n=1 Tax=Necator americanus TaxID=51031 RepID=A0ABR1CJF6_NECAM
MYFMYTLPLLLFFLYTQPAETADDNPITSRFLCRGSCCDHHEWCRFWASVGECKSNREWMSDNCQLACGTCRRGATRTPRPGVSPSSRPSRPGTRGRRPLSSPRAPPRSRRPNVFRRPSRPTRPTLPRVTVKTTPFARASRPRIRPTPSETELFLRGHQSSSSSALEPAVVVKLTADVPPPPPLRHFVLHPEPPPILHESTVPQSFQSIAGTNSVNEPRQETAEESRNQLDPALNILTFSQPQDIVSLSMGAPPALAASEVFTTPSTTSTMSSTTVSTTTTTTISTTSTSTATNTDAIAAIPMVPTIQERMPSEVPRTRTRPPPQPRTRPPPFARSPPQSRTRPPPQPRSLARPTPRPVFNREPITTTTRPTSPRTSPPARGGRNAARCQEILRDPLLAAEEMWREHLVVSTEDNSNRRTVDLDGVIRSNLANACVPRMDETSCERNICYNVYFRTMDGTCNNLQNPLRGASYRPYTRLLPTIYDNELSEPVGSIFPQLRPSPREITRRLTSSHASVVSDDYNAMIMQFGQFISHDLAKTTLIPSAKCNVCQNITSRCMAIPIAKDDPNAGFRKNTCVRVSRSSPICGSGNQKPRQQLNENTGYIDASPIYGSSVHDSEKFRQGKTGFLKLPAFNGMQMLPFDQSKCKSRKSCTVIFTAGDSRVNLFVGLSAWHTIFTKEHNRLVSILRSLNPHWDGERLYHEARKIVGAEVQAIVYREWLPKILGAAFSSVVGDYRGYDPTIDATIANEFTSAAFRFGHGMIQEFYQRLDPNFGNSSFGALPFQKGTLHSDVLVNEGGPDPLLRGMFSQSVKRPQRVTTTVTENMFGSTDLSSINIQRGRDHGHPSYTKYRELCGMGVATTFDHLSREILNTGTRDKLQSVYGSVDRIDLWVGALLEDPVVRGLVGPTIACIVGPQFKRTRDGDRFYYENPGVFTRQQLSEIRKSSLSRIICDNSNTISMVPREAFRLGHLTPCSQIPQMDLNKWKE